LDDYAFFAQAWQWGPQEVDHLKWSYRKKLKQAYKDFAAKQGAGKSK
jgi:hypothetical protein